MVKFFLARDPEPMLLLILIAFHGQLHGRSYATIGVWGGSYAAETFSTLLLSRIRNDTRPVNSPPSMKPVLIIRISNRSER